MSHFLPFYVQHSKGFISRLVEIARCGHYAVITTSNRYQGITTWLDKDIFKTKSNLCQGKFKI